MMSSFVSLVVFLLSVAVQVFCNSTGAPEAACADIYPVGHSGPSQDLTTNPFQLSLSDFDETYGGEFYYVPGQQYTLTLSGSGGEGFRGFLVQARTVADGSPVGSFIDSGNDQRLSNCIPNYSAVTHNNNDLKYSAKMNWTAPAEGTGDITFLFAVVVENTINSSIFYATAKSGTLHSCGLPLYESSGRCVETCPNVEFGNGNRTTLTGVCQQLPADYRIALNATIYYAEITTDTPLNTPVYRIRISINVNEEPIDISVRFFQTGQINSLFEFEGNTADNRRDISMADLYTIGNERVFNTSINLVADPASQFGEDDYPVELGLTIQFVVFTKDFISIQATSEGLGSIRQPPDPCDDEPCHNGASCASVNREEYTCSCLPGFSGAICEEVTDPCIAYQPCENQATCQTISSSEYSCHCQPGYTGQNCNSISDLCLVQDPCVNGSCTSDGALEYECECFAGYTGINCSSELDECLQRLCVNGNCIDGIASFTCECNQGYTGELCDVDVNECETADCHNGTCTDLVNDYMCNCYQDYTGQHCDETIDDCTSSPCNQFSNFSCEDGNSTYTCICDAGFTGPCVKISSNLYTCSQPGFAEQNCTDIVDNCLTNDCVKGTCIDGIASYTCECDPGYTGELCDVDINECETADCHNGTCINLINDYMCNCYQDYTGQHCDETIDDCASSPCNLLSSFLCEDGNSTYGCICDAGFTDQHKVNETECRKISSNLYTCSQPGFADQNCTDIVDNCTNDCVNGTCIDGIASFTCECNPGYTGELCDVEVNECETADCNNGTCTDLINDYMCNCYQDYTGQHCDETIDDCATSPCNPFFNFSCEDGNSTYTCICGAGFTGPCVKISTNLYTCSQPGFAAQNCTDIVDNCHTNDCIKGTCIDGIASYTCECNPGYTGEFCDVDVNECETVDCHNGTCTDLINDYMCNCYQDYTGQHCEETIDDCCSCPCNPHSSVHCEDGNSSYTCTCKAGFTGQNCTEEMLGCTSDPCQNEGTCRNEPLGDFTCTCPPEWTGKTCNNIAVSSTSIAPVVIGALVAVIMVLCVILVAIVGFRVYLSRHNHRKYIITTAREYVLDTEETSNVVISNYNSALTRDPEEGEDSGEPQAEECVYDDQSLTITFQQPSQLSSTENTMQRNEDVNHE